MASRTDLKNTLMASCVLVPFWKFDMMAFQAGLCVIQTQDVDARTTRPNGQHYAQDETLSI